MSGERMPLSQLNEPNGYIARDKKRSFLSRMFSRDNMQPRRFTPKVTDSNENTMGITERGNQVDITSFCDRWTSYDTSTCERHANTDFVGTSCVATETVFNTRSVALETDPLWDTQRVVSVESSTDTPDVYDVFYWLSGDPYDMYHNIEALLMKLAKSRVSHPSDAAFNREGSITCVTETTRLQDELLRVEARAIVLRKENEALRSLLSLPSRPLPPAHVYPPLLPPPAQHSPRPSLPVHAKTVPALHVQDDSENEVAVRSRTEPLLHAPAQRPSRNAHPTRSGSQPALHVPSQPEFHGKAQHSAPHASNSHQLRSATQPALHAPAQLSPEPSLPGRSFLITAQELPVTSTRDPGGPVIGHLKQGDVIVAFRSPEKDGRLPLKPRGWVTGGSLYMRLLI